jgi:hypothetical protein
MKILLESDVHSFEEALSRKLEGSGLDAPRIYEALNWLGVFSLYEPFTDQEKVSTSSASGHAADLSQGRPRTLLDAFCALLFKKLRYKKDERDFVLLTHRFKIVLPHPKSKLCTNLPENTKGSIQNAELERVILQEYTCSLILYGDPVSLDATSDASSVPSFSAMARTVGYPVALATELLLNASKEKKMHGGDGVDERESQSDSLPMKHFDEHPNDAAWIPAGVLLPTHRAIYAPILKACPALGIHFKESITHTPTLF